MTSSITRRSIISAAGLMLLPLRGQAATATTYYMSNSGSDGNNGTSPSTPWATISSTSPVNTKAFSPGDSILFQAGGVWRGRVPVTSNGLATGVITYGSYGTGAKPLFLGSANASGAAAWTLISGNLWKSVRTFPPKTGRNGLPYNAANDIGDVIFLNSSGAPTGAGHETFAKASVNRSPKPAAQGQWRFNQRSWQVELYSTSNPGTFYPGIELAIDQTAFELDSVSYITIKGFEFRYYASSGINGVGCSNINIAQNTMSWIGGGNLGGGGVRYGNGIQFYNGASNCTIEQNLISQVYDTPLTNQGNGGAYNNMTWRNNICWNASSYDMFDSAPSGTYQNISVYNNTFVGSNSWSTGQRPNGQPGFGINIGGSSGPVSNIAYVNNLLIDVTGCTIFADSFTQWKGALVLDYNMWKEVTGKTVICTPLGTLALLAWAAGYPAEQHGFIDQTPTFVDKAGGNFAPAAASLQLNHGENLFSAGVTDDFNGNPRPSTGAFTIGAIQ